MRFRAFNRVGQKHVVDCRKAKIAAGLLGFALASAGQCATITAVPLDDPVVVGEPVRIEFHLDFSDRAMLAGGLDVHFDPVRLRFEAFLFSSTLGDDVTLRRAPNALAGELNGIGFGEFISGLSGPARIGQVTFTALTAGHAQITLSENEGGPGNPGGFLPLEAEGGPLTVDFIGTAINVTPPPADEVSIPTLPAPLYPLLFGLLARLACLDHSRIASGILPRTQKTRRST